MSQDPDPHGQRPAEGQPPSLHKSPGGQPPSAGYPQAPGQGFPPAPGPSGYPTAPGPVGYGPGHGGGQPPKNGLGIAALVLGIASIPMGIFFFPVGIILGVLAVILGAVGMSRAKSGRATNRGVALAGLITGFLGAAIGIVFLVLTISVYSACSDELGSSAPSVDFEQCVTDELLN